MTHNQVDGRRALLVHAHSEPDSFVTSMRDRIAKTLQDKGWHIAHSDLHAMSWNPVLSPKDFGVRKNPDHLIYALEQRHNYTSGQLTSDVANEIEKILEADLLIFTFPVYWFNLPAILKGWVDRVFISGLFYGGKKIYSEGGMAGKEAIAALSLGGREDMFGQDSIHGDLVDGFLRSFFQGTLGYSGFAVLDPFIAFHTPYISSEDRAAILDTLDRDFASLHKRERLKMPDLRRFGEKFERLPA